VSVLRAAASFDPVIDSRSFETQVATELEMRNLALFDKAVNGAQVAMQIVGYHPGSQNFAAAIATVLLRFGSRSDFTPLYNLSSFAQTRHSTTYLWAFLF
jgi:hypothetical protein